MKGTKIGGHNVNSLRYVADVTLSAENESNLLKLVNKINEESNKRSLDLNSNKKRKATVILKSINITECSILSEREETDTIK